MMLFSDRTFIVSDPPQHTSGWNPAKYFLRFDDEKNILFSHCRFAVLPSAGLSGYAVFRGCRDVEFDSCEFLPMHGGFEDTPHHALAFFGDCQGVYVHDCVFDACHWGLGLGVGLAAGGENCRDICVDHNTFRNTLRASIAGGIDARISNNSFIEDDGKQHGSAIAIGVGSGDVSSNVLVEGNNINAPSTCCVQFDVNDGSRVGAVRIRNNTVRGSVGLQANRGSSVLIEHNDVTVANYPGPTMAGIGVTGVEDVTIRDNRVKIESADQVCAIQVGDWPSMYELHHADISRNVITMTPGVLAPRTSSGIVVHSRTSPTGHQSIRVQDNRVNVQGARHGICCYGGAKRLLVTGNVVYGHEIDIRQLEPFADMREIAHNLCGE